MQATNFRVVEGVFSNRCSLFNRVVRCLGPATLVVGQASQPGENP